MATKKSAAKRKVTKTEREVTLESELETAKAALDYGRVKEIRTQLKRLRTQRLAPKRVNKALKAIRQIEQLGNPVSYTLQDDEKDKIMQRLAEACGRVENALTQTANKDDEEFTL